MCLRCPLALVVALLLAASTQGLDNGLARTPPMGWLSWERFLCNVDCTRDPDNCIRYAVRDDSALLSSVYPVRPWQVSSVTGWWCSWSYPVIGSASAPINPLSLLVPRSQIHSKGLKFGIYQDCGTKTCAGFPGSLCHYVQDARTFAAWGVDMLKLDGCNINPIFMDRLYPAVTQALNATGRRMVFSCSWPAYQVDIGIRPNYRAIAENCNMWRNFEDITDSWVSVLHIVDYYASVQDTLTAVSGPGRWSDPDMLIIGNYGLSLDQSRAQMALWAILAAPLFMSVDLRTIRPEHKDILTNPRVIAINQDPMGRMGRRICVESGVEIWGRSVLPLADDKSTSAAIVFFNRRNLGGPVNVTIKLSSLALNYRNGYDVLDLFNHDARSAWFMPDDDLTAMVNPSGVIMLKATPRLPPPTPRLPPPTPAPTQAPPPLVKGVDIKVGHIGADLNVAKGGQVPVVKVTSTAEEGIKGGVVTKLKGATILETKGGPVTVVEKAPADVKGVKTGVKGK
ncbi:unnamed protein product [Ixodes hexagonus]